MVAPSLASSTMFSFVRSDAAGGMSLAAVAGEHVSSALCCLSSSTIFFGSAWVSGSLSSFSGKR